jgi:ankyrin repeat protein
MILKGIRAAATLLTALTLMAAVPGPGSGPGAPGLLEAAQKGDLAGVQAALKAHADVNGARGDGLTALHLAAQRGSLPVVQALLKAKANVEARTRIGGYTPLHLAAEAGEGPVVTALLAAGADPNVVTTTSGVTPLHLAAKALDGDDAVVALLEHGAKPNVTEKAYGQTPLMFAASHGRAAAIRELLKHGADASVKTESVDLLEQMRVDREAIAKMRTASADIRRSTPDGTKRELTPTEEQKAIATTRTFLSSKDEIAKTLQGFKPDDLSRKRPWWSLQNGVDHSTDSIMDRPIQETLVRRTGGMTALLHAAREGQIEAAKALLDGGADINQQSADGSTPLVESLLNGHYDLAMELIKRGADVNLATNTDGVAPLFAVLQTQWTLRFTNQPQPRAQDNQQTDYMAIVNALLEKGANPNVRLTHHLWFFEWEDKFGIDLTGATPFWRAAFAQDLDAMKALAAHGADPNIPTAWPEPGLRGARQEDGRVAEDSGLPVKPEGSPNLYPIQGAAGGGYLGLGAFQQNNVPNNFMAATKFMVEELHADVNLPDSWGYTPLHYAAVRGDNDLVKYLVDHGANVKAVTQLGQSVVDMTRGGRNGFFHRTPYPETEQLLLKLGSPYLCLHTHMRNNGDWCPGAGVAPFKDAADVEDQVVKNPGG